MRRLRLTSLTLVCALTLSSCIHRVDNRQPSPFEQAVTYLSMLSATNDTIAEAVITANKAGELSVTDTDRILHFQALIADDHQRLMAIMNSGVSGATASSDTVNLLLQDIKTQANALIASGGLGIKNARTQRTVADDVNSILSLGPLVTRYLQLAGVLK